MNPKAFYTLITACILLASFAPVRAQSPKVEYITFTAVKQDTIVEHLDTFKLFYSNNRGGVAIPELEGKSYQPLFFDSMISIATNPSPKISQYKTYDTKNRILTDIRKADNTEKKYVYTYDTSGLLVSINYFWQSTAQSTQELDSMVYNSSGQLISHMKFRTSAIPITRYDYSYSGTDLAEITYYQSNVIQKHTRNFYTSGMLDSSYAYTYFYSTPVKIKHEKSYNFYSGSLLDSTNRYYRTDTATNNKYYKSQYRYHYNINNRVTEHNIMFWDTVANTWENYEKYETIYNAQNNIDTFYESLWEAGTRTFRYRIRELYYYDANHLFAYKIMQTVRNGKWIHGYWDMSILDSVSMYHYDTVVAPTSIAETNASVIKSVQVFPNPATSYISVDLGTDKIQPQQLAIYDMAGRLRQQIPIRKGSTGILQIPVAALPAGNYVLYLSGNKVQAATQFSIVK